MIRHTAEHEKRGLLRRQTIAKSKSSTLRTSYYHVHVVFLASGNSLDEGRQHFYRNAGAAVKAKLEGRRREKREMGCIKREKGRRIDTGRQQ